MIFQRANLVSRANVPDFDEPVVAAGRERLAVGAKRKIVNAIGVSGDLLFRLRRSRTIRSNGVQPNLARLPRDTARDAEPRAVAAPCQRGHRAGLSGDACD